MYSITCSNRVVTYSPAVYLLVFSFFFTATAPPEIYTLSLHDALPISGRGRLFRVRALGERGHPARAEQPARRGFEDRKSTRLNSSHRCISYAVFCLKKKKKKKRSNIKNTQHTTTESKQFIISDSTETR